MSNFKSQKLKFQSNHRWVSCNLLLFFNMLLLIYTQRARERERERERDKIDKEIIF